MHIFIDSNIIFDKWKLNNADFQYLFNFINNDYNTLLISKLVIEETENNRKKQVEKINSALKKITKEYNKLCSQALDANDLSIKHNEYNLNDIIKDKTNNVQVFDYVSLSHNEIVQRTLSNRKPFLAGEKGYRDTLIWLSFLDHVVHNSITGDIAFITNNTNDFFKKKGDNYSLHQDLINDISSKDIKANIVPYNSLFSFIKDQVDKGYHELDHDKLIEAVEEDIVDLGLEHIEDVTEMYVTYRSKGGLFHTTIKEILSTNTDLIEGLEDPEVMHVSKLSQYEVHVGYRYNLRRVYLEIDISKSNYLLNKEEFDEMFFEIIQKDDIVTMNSVVRPYFSASFIFDKADEDLKDYDVDEMTIRI